MKADVIVLREIVTGILSTTAFLRRRSVPKKYRGTADYTTWEWKYEYRSLPKTKKWYNKSYSSP